MAQLPNRALVLHRIPPVIKDTYLIRIYMYRPTPQNMYYLPPELRTPPQSGQVLGPKVVDSRGVPTAV